MWRYRHRSSAADISTTPEDQIEVVSDARYRFDADNPKRPMIELNIYCDRRPQTTSTECMLVAKMARIKIRTASAIVLDQRNVYILNIRR